MNMEGLEVLTYWSFAMLICRENLQRGVQAISIEQPC